MLSVDFLDAPMVPGGTVAVLIALSWSQVRGSKLLATHFAGNILRSSRFTLGRLETAVVMHYLVTYVLIGRQERSAPVTTSSSGEGDVRAAVARPDHAEAQRNVYVALSQLAQVSS